MLRRRTREEPLTEAGQAEAQQREGFRQRRARLRRDVRPDVPVIEVRDVSKAYEGGHLALDHVSLTVGRGEFVFIVGPTGCGKSTFMRLLLKEIAPTEGDLLIAGRELSEVPPRRVPYLRRNIGVVFQDFKLLPNRTVYANVAYSLEVIGEPRAGIRKKVPDILRLVGLSTKLHSFPDQLSGGEQQRVSIARAFVNHPPLLLADEPTGNLDPETSIGIMQLLYRINRTGTTVVVASHDREMVDKMRRRVIEVHEGRVVRDQAAGLYASDENTTEFGVRVREEMAAEAGIWEDERARPVAPADSWELGSTEEFAAVERGEGTDDHPADAADRSDDPADGWDGR